VDTIALSDGIRKVCCPDGYQSPKAETNGSRTELMEVSPEQRLEGQNLRAVQLLLGHTKLESTVSYLGIEVDDALKMAEQTEV
jgi:hypothetical protein